MKFNAAEQVAVLAVICGAGTLTSGALTVGNDLYTSGNYIFAVALFAIGTIVGLRAITPRLLNVMADCILFSIGTFDVVGDALVDVPSLVQLQGQDEWTQRALRMSWFCGGYAYAIIGIVDEAATGEDGGRCRFSSVMRRSMLVCTIEALDAAVIYYRVGQIALPLQLHTNSTLAFVAGVVLRLVRVQLFTNAQALPKREPLRRRLWQRLYRLGDPSDLDGSQPLLVGGFVECASAATASHKSEVRPEIWMPSPPTATTATRLCPPPSPPCTPPGTVGTGVSVEEQMSLDVVLQADRLSQPTPSPRLAASPSAPCAASSHASSAASTRMALPAATSPAWHRTRTAEEVASPSVPEGSLVEVAPAMRPSVAAKSSEEA
eukprot:CAMPEP_0115832632 /NCGR_PEP_ID=MMETSP0287-20121206/2759_1 /TAXON_ID=412157 /ORGANISM="Chrysochromulina rotalis, Strain UIO044" /LENGTH=376 /DNA_ID=CAMNT_0003286025 /DNA_START=498 /DNA_END=1625 /DNA_ORIENTATION=-